MSKLVVAALNYCRVLAACLAFGSCAAEDAGTPTPEEQALACHENGGSQSCRNSADESCSAGQEGCNCHCVATERSELCLRVYTRSCEQADACGDFEFPEACNTPGSNPDGTTTCYSLICFEGMQEAACERADENNLDYLGCWQALGSSTCVFDALLMPAACSPIIGNP